MTKAALWELLELTEDEHGKTRWDLVDVFLLGLIILSLLAVVFETVQGLYRPYRQAFHAFDIFTVVVFSLEYLLRVWACTVDPRYSDPVRGRLRYMASFYGIVDALAILPFYAIWYVPLAFVDLRFLRVLRLMRFARVLKLGRYSEATDRLKAVFLSKRADLGVALFAVLITLVLASSVMYHVENVAQPEKFSSIPAAMWWGVSTLTTVGYGDIHPITPLGKLIAAVIQLMGIALFALPAGILASGYEDESIKRRALNDGLCPTCGRDLGSKQHQRTTPHTVEYRPRRR